MCVKTRVAAYCRVSTDEEIQESSYNNQIQVYLDKIRENPDWVLADIYADAAVSGTTEKRPEFQRMLEDATKKKFDLLLVKSISRFARNTLISIQTVRQFKELGIGVVFEKENIDTTKPYSEMTLTILSSFAQEESRNASERVKKGIQMRIARGEISWTPLYGYTRKDGEEYIIVEHEAKVIRNMFEDYAKGIKTAQIINKLNEAKIPSPGGGLWLDTTVTFILQNERYMGSILTSKNYIEDHITHKQKKNTGEIPQHLIPNHHRPIIDKELFQQAQTVRKLRTNHTYPYADFLVCPVCGRRIGRFNKGWGCSCGQFYMPVNRLNMAVLRAYELSTGASQESVEYWWLEELIDFITFDKDGRKLTVHWKKGETTEVETGYLRMWGDINFSKTQSEKKKTKPRNQKSKVMKIEAKKQ